METENKSQPTDKLPEEEFAETPKKKPNVALNIILGVFFIGYGIFRLTNRLPGDGSWSTFVGCAMIVLGITRIVLLAFNK